MLKTSQHWNFFGEAHKFYGNSFKNIGEHKKKATKRKGTKRIKVTKSNGFLWYRIWPHNSFILCLWGNRTKKERKRTYTVKLNRCLIWLIWRARARPFYCLLFIFILSFALVQLRFRIPQLHTYKAKQRKGSHFKTKLHRHKVDHSRLKKKLS